jgi:predicted dehydrogenase
MTSGLRIGVVGAGYWGSKHVRTLSSNPEVDQVAVIDPSAARVAALKRTYPALQCFAALTEALPALDAVVIATPPTTHAGLALEALHAGRHVMVEKPLATSRAEAQQVVDAAAERDLVVMVGHTFEHHAAVWALRDIVRGDGFGDLYFLETARLNMGLYQHDVNVLWDLAPHDISILNYVVGSPPTSVSCWGSRHAHSRLEDIAHLRLYYEEPEVEATVHVSWLHPCKTRRVTAVGSEQMVVFDDLETEERIRVHHKCVRQPELTSPDLSHPPMSYQYGDVVAPYLVVNEPLAVEDQHFVDCIRSHSLPSTSGESGLAVVQVLEAAQRSLLEGRRVGIESPPSRGRLQPVADAGAGIPRQPGSRSGNLVSLGR